MSRPLDWEREGHLWPDRAASRFVSTGKLTWRTIDSGTGPCLLLLHGTGSSAHSWRGIVDDLAVDFRVIAPDLPGHGFTRGRPRRGLTLRGMAEAVAELLGILDARPALIVGHSAGAAIGLQYAIDSTDLLPVIGFNPAITPFPGLAAPLFSTMARLLLVNPIAPGLFARIARSKGETERFLRRSTGSRIEPAGLACYEALFGNSRHCRGALEMMASWDLDPLYRRLPECHSAVRLIHSMGDSAVPLASVRQAADRLPNCTLDVWPGLGHLAHEEQPGKAARSIRDQAARLGLTTATESTT